MKLNKIPVLLASVILLVVVVPFLLNFYGELLWFSSLGFSSVLFKMIKYDLLLGILTGSVFFIISYLNYLYSTKVWETKENLNHLILGFIALVSVFIGIQFANWQIVLRFINSTSFGTVDPVFSKDISFFVFKLPFFRYLASFTLFSVLFSLLLSLITFIHNSLILSGYEFDFFQLTEFFHQAKEKAKRQIFSLLGLLIIIVGLWLYLARYSFLFSPDGAVFGAGYLQVNFLIPFYALLSLSSILIGLFIILSGFSVWSKISGFKVGYKHMAYLVIALIIVGIVGSAISAGIQSYLVKPDEFNKEEKFIERNIDFTREAYDLDIKSKEFNVSNNLSKDVIQSETLKNIRLWDWKPLQQTFDQVQALRSYYNFYDVDVDRYMVDGDYRQVMLSPRELVTSELPSKSWVNKHLAYTHGYGIVMSSVNQVSSEGQPKFFIKDIPPKYSKSISSLKNVSEETTSNKEEMKRPEIYYGENLEDYIVSNTDTDEFDYPKGDENVYTNYKGQGGVELSSIVRKLSYALKQNSINLLISGSINSDSRIIINRNVVKRAKKVAPYLRYDSDPYAVTCDGSLHYIIDAYSASDSYPYSEPTALGSGFDWEKINYIRNSVKVVVDAYTGEVDFYKVKEDPVIDTYSKIFPEVYQDFSKMPDCLQKHIRYPQDLFEIQTSRYSNYHMEDSKVFYNKEDSWNIPQESYRGSQIKMEPYYVVMELPDRDRKEFVLIMPFVPKGRDNMVAWMAAHSDMPYYGNLTLYKFTKQELVYGPMQVENRIEQHPRISEKLSLWSQRGSRVIRGNLLAIPVDNSIVYVEPIFLRSEGEGAIPQLKRVIVASGDKLVMEPTLEQALAKLVGAYEPKPPVVNRTRDQFDQRLNVTIGLRQKIKRASDLYKQSQSDLRQGNFTSYSRKIKEVGDILSDLENKSSLVVNQSLDLE